MAADVAHRRMRSALGAVLVVALAVVAPLAFTSKASAQPAPVGLGTADSFAVLAGSTVTNTGPSVINGDLGVSPGDAVTGFPPGTVNGTIHAGNAVAAQAQDDLTTAYNSAAGRACDTDLTDQDLGGLTLTAGVYCFSSSAQLTGTLTLDAQGDPNAVFIFQIGTTLTTASNSSVNLINGAQSCNVFWQVGSSATLGTTTTFRGNVLALTSITLNTNATVDGRTLARNAAVTLDSNTVTRAVCATPEPSPEPEPEPEPTPTPSPEPEPEPAPTAEPAPTPGPTLTPGPTPGAPGVPDDDAPDEPVPVQPPTRIDTGGGGAATPAGPSGLPLLLVVVGAVLAVALRQSVRLRG